MKKKAYIMKQLQTVLLISILAAIAHSAITPLSYAQEVTLEQLQGEWINKVYVEKLKATRSPYQAVEDIYYACIVIEKVNDSFRFVKLYNFHIGPVYRVKEFKKVYGQSLYEIVYEPVYMSETPDWLRRDFTDRFRVFVNSDITEIEWIFTQEHSGSARDREQRIRLVRADPDIYKFANTIALAGEYTDQSGRRFVFRNTDTAAPYGTYYSSYPSEAVWPDKSFRYTIGIDCVLERFDHFMMNERDENNEIVYTTFGYVRADNILYIYNTHDPEGKTGILKMDETPIYILTPQ
jgi:hypothetical protein